MISDKLLNNKTYETPLNFGEEAVETVIAALNEPKENFLNESADLLFHLLVLIQAKGNSLEEVIDVLKKRNSK